jgi:hypothetical protein
MPDGEMQNAVPALSSSGTWTKAVACLALSIAGGAAWTRLQIPSVPSVCRIAMREIKIEYVPRFNIVFLP